jgi:antitoxin component of MazEF toxin-antitoxin module
MKSFSGRFISIIKLYSAGGGSMNMFEATPKKVGNSIAFIVPNEIVKANNISINRKMKVLLLPSNMERARKVFGKLKLKRSTQDVMDEIDEGYD